MDDTLNRPNKSATGDNLIPKHTLPPEDNLNKPIESATEDPLIRMLPDFLFPSEDNLRLDTLYVGSIHDAVTILNSDEYSDRLKGGLLRQKLIDFIITHKTPGDSPVRHQLIQALVDIADYLGAYQFCVHSLKQGFWNSDILADAVFLCTKLGDFKMAETYVEIVEMIPKSQWSERMFSCCIIAIQSIALNTYQNAGVYWEKSENLTKDYIYFFKDNEEGYYLSSKNLYLQNKRIEAISELRRTIFERPNGAQLRCPNCCLLLLVLLESSSDYELVRIIAEQGLKYTDGNKSVDFYFSYRKARAMEDELESRRTEGDVPKVKQAYKMALQMITNQTKGILQSGASESLVPVSRYEDIIKNRLIIIDSRYS